MTSYVANQWLIIHLIGYLTASAAFTAAFAAAAGYYLQERMLKKKQVNALQRLLPALGACDRLAYRTAAFGFVMLTMGIIARAVWSQMTRGALCHCEPGEPWLLVTWLVYAAYLHVRGIGGWRGKWANRLLTAGFVTVLLNWADYGFQITGWRW
jgi:ABC-type transport system involved in cytochrome c biogenesis permease subunit